MRIPNFRVEIHLEGALTSSSQNQNMLPHNQKPTQLIHILRSAPTKSVIPPIIYALSDPADLSINVTFEKSQNFSRGSGNLVTSCQLGDWPSCAKSIRMNFLRSKPFAGTRRFALSLRGEDISVTGLRIGASVNIRTDRNNPSIAKG